MDAIFFDQRIDYSFHRLVDIVAHTERRAHVYENLGQNTESGLTLGTPVNFTLY